MEKQQEEQTKTTQKEVKCQTALAVEPRANGPAEGGSSPVGAAGAPVLEEEPSRKAFSSSRSLPFVPQNFKPFLLPAASVLQSMFSAGSVSEVLTGILRSWSEQVTDLESSDAGGGLEHTHTVDRVFITSL